MFMALAKPMDTNKKHGRKKWEGVAPWGKEAAAVEG